MAPTDVLELDVPEPDVPERVAVLERLDDAALIRAMAIGSERAHRTFCRRHRNRAWKLVNRTGAAAADTAPGVADEALRLALRRAAAHPAGASIDEWLAALCREVLGPIPGSPDTAGPEDEEAGRG